MSQPTSVTTAIRAAVRRIGPATREQIRAELPGVPAITVNWAIDGMRRNRQLRRHARVPVKFADMGTRLCTVYALPGGK